MRANTAQKKAPPKSLKAVIRGALGPDIAKSFLSQRTSSLDWDVESRYASEIIADPRNDYLRSIVESNPDSLANALLDLARLGLSLSPTAKQAYLVPRSSKGKGIVVATPSYLGFEHGAMRSGKVTLIQTDLVYENDEFKRWTEETGAKLMHIPARKDRGELEGGYCLARFGNGEVRIEYMSAEDIEACRKASIRQNKGVVPPSWQNFESEMQKAKVVRRAAKHWPHDPHITFMASQMDAADPIFDDEPADAEPTVSDERIDEIAEKMVRVPADQRHAWLHNCAMAMGIPGGYTELPASRADELETRLLARMEKVYPEEKKETADEPKGEGDNAEVEASGQEKGND